MTSILDFNFDEEMTAEPMDFNQFCLPELKHCKLSLPKGSKKPSRTSKQATRPQAQTRNRQEHFKSLLDRAGIDMTRKGHAHKSRFQCVLNQRGKAVLVKRFSRPDKMSSNEDSVSLADSREPTPAASVMSSNCHTRACTPSFMEDTSAESSSDDDLDNLEAPPSLLRNRRTPLPTLIQAKPEDVESVNGSASVSSEAAQSAETQQVAPPATQQNVPMQPQAVPTSAAPQYLMQPQAVPTNAAPQYMYMQPQQMQPLQYPMQQPQQYTVQQPQYVMPPSPAMMPPAQAMMQQPYCAPFTAPVTQQYSMPAHQWAMQQVSPTMQLTSPNGCYSQGNYSTASTQTAYPPTGSCRSSCHSQQSACNNTGAPVMPVCGGDSPECASCRNGNHCTERLKLMNHYGKNIWTPEEKHALMKAYPIVMTKAKMMFPETFKCLEEE